MATTLTYAHNGARTKKPSCVRDLLWNQFRLDKQRRQNERDRGEKYNQHVQAGAGSILEGIANCVPDDGRFMCFRSFTSVYPCFDKLLGVVPGTTAIVQNGSHQNSTDGTNHQKRR